MLTKHVLSHYDDITQLKQRNKHTKKTKNTILKRFEKNVL